MKRLLAMSVVLLFVGCKGDPGGKELYDTACSRCHGDKLEGGIKTGAATSRDLTDPAWQKTVTDAELRQIVRNGRGEMPAFGTVLTMDRIDKIVKYIRTKKRSD